MNPTRYNGSPAAERTMETVRFTQMTAPFLRTYRFSILYSGSSPARIRLMKSRLAETSSGCERSWTLSWRISSREYPVISQKRWFTEIQSSSSVRCAIPIAACSKVARRRWPGPPRGTAYSAVQPGTAEDGASIGDSCSEEVCSIQSHRGEEHFPRPARYGRSSASNFASPTFSEQKEFR